MYFHNTEYFHMKPVNRIAISFPVVPLDFMLMTQDSIGCLKMLYMSVLSVNGGGGAWGKQKNAKKL